MDEREIAKLRGQIKAQCRRYKMFDMDDIVQDVFVRVLAGTTSNVGQMVIDCIRQKLGDPRVRRKNLLRRAYSPIEPEVSDMGRQSAKLSAKIDVERLLSTLPKFEALILELRHIDGYTMSEIGELLGRCETTWQVERRALAYLRENL